MQQQEVRINTQKSVDARIAAGTPRLTARRIDFKAIKRAAGFERVLQHYGIELRSGHGVTFPRKSGHRVMRFSGLPAPG